MAGRAGRGAGLPVPAGRGAELPVPAGRGAGLPVPAGRGAGLPVPAGRGAGLPVPAGRGAGLPVPAGRGAELPIRAGRGAELPGRAGRGAEVPGRAGRGAEVPIRAGRGLRAPRCPIGESDDSDRSSPIPDDSDRSSLEDSDRSTSSPEHTKFMIRVAHKSPNTSPTDDQSPVGSPTDGSPTALSSPSAQMSQLRIVDKYTEPPAIEKSFGREGTSLPVALNYVKVLISPASGPFLYCVRFDPDIDSIDVRRKLICSSAVHQALGTKAQAFTGMNLYLPIMLDQQSVTVPVPNPGEPEVIVNVTIEYLKKPQPEELIPFYNTLLRRCMRELQLVQIKQHYFMPTERIAIPHLKLEVWPGQVCKITDLDHGLLLICEASHRVLQTRSALEMLREIHRTDPLNFKDNAKRQLIGSVVLTRYNNKPYRIDDIDFKGNPQSTFTKSDGTTISYVQYFQSQWNLTIADKNQPLFIHNPKPRRGETDSRFVTLIPEFSSMTGLTDHIRSDNRAMRDIAAHTRIRPEVRYQKLLKFLSNLEGNQAAKNIFEEWGVSLDTKPLEINARLLSSETLLFGRGRKVNVPENVGWSREASCTALFSSSEISDWVVIYNKREEKEAGDIVSLLRDVVKFMGFGIEAPRRLPLTDENVLSYVNAIRSALTPTTQIVMILTSGASMREDRYNAIKRICCCELAVPSQVVRMATIGDQKKARSVAQRVALQMQCKIGGTPWVVSVPFKTAMFVGIDVYHDPNRQAKSCIAFVATVDAICTKWFSKVAFQGTSEEIGHTLQSSLLAAMDKFKENTGAAPDRIFIFRDGVGDGQVPVVANYEVPQMVAAAGGYGGSVTPKITCVVVQKRVDTRFLLRTASGAFDNPKAGTVLDRAVTRKNFEDFYLVAQSVTQGTVSPCHYVIVANQTGLDADKIQRLTYRMTHLYYNWPGTVRVPAQCQYAHKIAYLVGQNVKAIPKDSISDRLYFL